jgi:hypothetical protein
LRVVRGAASVLAAIPGRFDFLFIRHRLPRCAT